MDLKKILVVPFGDWLGHSQGEQHYGPKEAAAIVARFNEVVGKSGNPLQIDYDHQSLTADQKSGPVPAAGFMHELVVENDGIYAMVEWTPTAKDLIDKGEYRYVSPVIAGGLPDPVTGEPVPIELFNAAITNQPFMHDRMKRIAASAMQNYEKDCAGQLYYTNSKQLTFINQNGAYDMDPKELVTKAAAALGLPETATADDVIALLKKAGELAALLPGAPEGGGMPTEEPEMEAMMAATRKIVANAKILDDVASELKVEADKVLPTIKAMSTKAGTSDELRDKVAKLEAREAEREITDLIKANENKIPPAEREAYIEFGRKHGKEALEFSLSKLSEIIPNGKPKTVPAKDQIDAERKVLASRMGLTDEDIQKYSRKNTEA